MASTQNMLTTARFVSRRFSRGAAPRHFASSTRCMINPLFNLSQFSASKEAQYLSKEKRMPREEFYPYIELIRMSEVDPFAPVPGASATAVAALKRAREGKSDMQTTYSLAIQNLAESLRLARRETLHANAALADMHFKHRREERNALLVMLSAVALLSFIMLKTDAWSDLKEYLGGVKHEWRVYDWEWLGNPPSYKSAVHDSTLRSPSRDTTRMVFSTPNGTSPQLREQQQKAVIPLEEKSSSTPPACPSQGGWSLSRLFWAGVASEDA